MVCYFNEDSGDAVFNYNEVGIVNIDLNNINRDYNFDEEDPNPIILIRLFWPGILNLKNANNFNTRLRGILKDGGIGACQKMRKWK